MTIVNSSPSPSSPEHQTLRHRISFTSRLSPRPLHALLPSRNVTKSTDTPSKPSSPSCAKSLLFFILFLYAIIFILLSFSHRFQTYFIYLHWVRPPAFLFPLHRLEPYRLASSARVVSQDHLRGWHLLPPGPPFVDGSDSHFDTLLARPAQRVIIFFHGNSGTRACPRKRVDAIRLLSTHFRAHVVTFDYSGFGDSGGRPSEQQFHDDARSVFEWVNHRVSDDTDIVIYGQSLGTFAAVDLAASLSDLTDLPSDIGARAVILDAPPASLVDAALTHPVTSPFRIIPKAEALFRFVLHEKLDSVMKVGRIRIPLLLLHGEQDSMITIQQSERLYEEALRGGNEHVQFVRFPTCGHNNVIAAPEYLRVVHGFFDKYLSEQCRLQGKA